MVWSQNVASPVDLNLTLMMKQTWDIRPWPGVKVVDEPDSLQYPMPLSLCADGVQNWMCIPVCMCFKIMLSGRHFCKPYIW